MLNRILTASLTALLLAGSIGGASASTWGERHPRRVEVNHRLMNQDRRIHHDVATGKITHAQAVKLHAEDRAIRGEERTDARFHRTHLTRADQRSLNQNENAVSRQIYKDAH